ncbi:nickel pincer cofactor biosynthesis protein LarC [Limnospira platensis]|uniref:nickel pincer cofactor biosynthesis protein LarC n=1 Tax=Limnospira platensis TaxID=118562 RepID=UPI003D6F49EE
MINIAYLQCPTGIAGDMCLAALVHAGVPLEYLTTQLERLGMAEEYRLWAEKVTRQGQQATKVHVDLTRHDHHTRHLPDIEAIIKAAKLPPRAENMSLAVFRKLAEAEGAVHGIDPEKVHFHEVGATDAIVDIVGTCLGLDWLKIDRLYCSAFPVGGGTFRAAHGILPVPAPAVLKLWEMRSVPVYSNGIERELVTPTGAAIAVTLATEFGPPPPMILQRVGLGAGSSNFPIPNILRLWLGETEDTDKPKAESHGLGGTFHDHDEEMVAVLETQIDDLSPQAIAYASQALLSAGAVDVFVQPVTMKKSRLGVLLTVICHPEAVDTCRNILFAETTTLGIRQSWQCRTILNRELQTVDTEYGLVRIKVAFSGDRIINVHPEYEDCATLAQQHQIPWLDIHQKAIQHWQLIQQQAESIAPQL